MARRRILVVEDDAAIREVLVDALELEGFEVLESGTFERGLDTAVRIPCDLMLLDLVLPDGDGFTLLERARSSRPSLPVIVLTARGREDDRVAGLTLGADDYVVKPFSIKEVLARVQAVLRRSAERPSDDLEVRFQGGVALLAESCVRLDDGREHSLSEREIDLLRYLARNRGRTISREELLARVWHLPGNRVRTRTVDMHIARLRDKLSDPGAEPRIIVTVRGKGYRFQGLESEP